MSSQITTFGAQAWGSMLFNLQPVPSEYWLAMAVGEPGVDSDGDLLVDLEPPTAAGYGRVAVPLDATHWGISGGILTNLLDIPFGPPTDDWGRPDHYVLCDAAASGDIYAYGEIYNAVLVTSGFLFSLPAGGIEIALGTLDVPIAI
jgi:hypothetical protein